MDEDKTIYVENLLETISTFKILTSIGIILIFLIIISFRIMDNLALIDYLIVMEAIKGDLLKNRIAELKSAINQVHKLNANHIDSV